MKISYPKLHSFKLKTPQNVVFLPVESRLDIPVDRVLFGALEKNLEDVLVVGRAGSEYYYASSSAKPEVNLYLLERFKNIVV